MLDSERSEIPEAIYNNVDPVRRLDLKITEKQQPLQHTGTNIIYLIHYNSQTKLFQYILRIKLSS